MSALTLYGSVHDPISQSMMLLLQAKNIPHEVVEVRTNKEAVRLQNGKVRAKTFLEAIRFLESDASLPAVHKRENTEKILTDFADNIEPLFYRSVLTGNPREGLDLFFESISYLENILDGSVGPFFGGKAPDVLDYGLYPWIEKVGPWLPKTERGECAKLQTWVRKMSRLPLVVKLMPDTDKETLDIYKRLVPDDTLLKFTPKS